MRCPYIYPRDEDWIVARLAEQGRRVLVVGPHGSGVTTLVERLSRILGQKIGRIVDAESIPLALESLRGGARVVGVSLELLEVAKLPSIAPSDVEIVVLKPLSPAEAHDYMVNVLGVQLESIELVDEVIWRSGGYPGAICRVVLQHRLRGRALTRDNLAVFGDMPPWLHRALGAGRELRSLAGHVFLKRFRPELARQLDLETSSPWLRSEGEWLTVWDELLWLEPFLQRLFPGLAVKAYREALRDCSDPYLCFIHAANLYSLVGKEAGKELLRRAREAVDDVRDPAIRYRLARTVLETAVEIEPVEAPYWLSKLLEAHEMVELTPADATWLLGVSKKLRQRGILGQDEYIELLSQLGRRLAQWGHSDSLEPVLSELEALMWEGASARRAEEVYNTLQAWRYAVQGRWRTTLSILEETGETTDDTMYLSTLAHLALGDTRGARQRLGKLRNTQYRLLAEALVELMEAESLAEADERLRQIADTNPYAATILSIIEAARGRQPPAPSTPHWLAHAATALYLIANGKVAEAYRMIEPVKDTIPQLTLLALDLAVAALAHRAPPHTLLAAVSHLEEELSRLELQGAAKTLHELGEAIRKGDEDKTRLLIAKLIAYSVYL